LKIDGKKIEDIDPLTQYAQAILTILSLVNPVICAAIFTKLTQGQTHSTKIAGATKAALAIVVILCLAALGGAQLLKAFGISLSAFQVAGGMVLVWMGFIMLRGNSSPTSTSGSDINDDKPDETKADASSLTPVILFGASPGTITGVITLAVSHSQGAVPMTALIAVITALSATWLIMVISASASGDRKPGLVHDVTTRFMGLIVLSMGVQFALTGLDTFFNSQ
jgi:multiple antibiotic resistance protein